MQSNNEKILFLINSLGRGGAEKVFTEEALAFAERGCPVWLGTLRKEGLFSHSGVSYIAFNFQNPYDIGGYWRLLNFIQEHRITHLYATLDEATIVGRLIALVLPRLSVSVRESGLPARKSFKLKLFDILLNWRVHKIVAVSSGVARGLAVYQSIYGKKIVIVENGMLSPTQSCQACIETKTMHHKQPVRVIAVARLTKEKNHTMLLKVFSHIKKNNPNSAQLTIIGDGPLYNELSRQIKEFGIEDSVTLVGSLSFDKVQLEYQKADIFVHSSYGEGFPNVILEAMSYALPVLATSVPGAVDAIQNEVSGLLTGVGDDAAFQEQLERLVADPALRIRLGRAACERVRSVFSFERHMERLIKVL